MPHPNMKPPDPGREDAQLRDSEETSSKTIELAKELIRTLDAESNQHMEQISAEDKLGNS